jgi:hypothetical protein
LILLIQTPVSGAASNHSDSPRSVIEFEGKEILECLIVLSSAEIIKKLIITVLFDCPTKSNV